jgi:hypothetical protein
MQTEFSNEELNFRLNNDLTNVEVFQKLFLEGRIRVLKDLSTKFYDEYESFYSLFELVKSDEKNISLLNSNNIKEFIPFIKILNEIYPSQWDFCYTLEGKDILISGICIKFDKFTISNSAGFSHTIENLIVSLCIYYDTMKESFLIYPNLYGYRTTLTKAELDSNYMHSHLCTEAKGIFKESDYKYCYERFCLGESVLKGLFKEQFKEGVKAKDIFKDILLNIFSTISYESLEGTPYKNISSIKESSELSSKGYIDIGSSTVKICNIIYDIVVKNKIPFNISFIEEGIKVSITPEGEDRLIEESLKVGLAEPGFTFIYFIDNMGSKYWYTNVNIEENISGEVETGVFTIFKSKKLPYIVKYEESKEDNIKPKLYMDETIKSLLCQKIEYYINSKILS